MTISTDTRRNTPITLLPTGIDPALHAPEMFTRAQTNKDIIKDIYAAYVKRPHLAEEAFLRVFNSDQSVVFPVPAREIPPEDIALIRWMASLSFTFYICADGSTHDPDKVITAETLQQFTTFQQLVEFIESSIEAVISRTSGQRALESDHARDLENVAVSQEVIADELAALSPETCIITKAHFKVYLVRADAIPNILQEIGRLRELTFRQVGEGTGSMLDTDEFDAYYYQLIIFDDVAKRIVGGYRVAHGAEIFERFGINGFYISKLFDIQEPFYPYMKQALELGRSYIIQDYQRQRLPLFLLWKGILHFLMTRPDIKYIYGPVSISKYYSDISKGFIIEFLKLHYYNEALAKYIKPRKAFKPRFDSINYHELVSNMEGEINELDRFIEAIDPHFFKIPVLVRQYIRQNAKFVGFNVDPNFSDALDGFMLLDIKNLPQSTLEALHKI